MMFFHPQFRGLMRAHAFIRFNFWMMVTNLPVYWLSVQVYPRYVLMFIPLFNMVGYYIVQQDKEGRAGFWKALRYLFLLMAGVAFLASLALPLMPSVDKLQSVTWIWIGSAVGLGLGFAGMLLDEKRSFLWLAISLLVVRIVFNAVVLPLRQLDHDVNEVRADCQRIAKVHGEQTWYLYKETFPHEVARFYTAAYSNQIVRHAEGIQDMDALYLVDRKMYPDFPGVMVDSLKTEGKQVLALMRPE
jgi:hypothetical protein